MKNRNWFRGIVIFLSGVLTAVVLQTNFTGHQEALADQYSCIRTDLDAQGMTGNIPDPEFTITYNVPACYANRGYTVEKAYKYGNQIAVKYKNPNAVSSILNNFTGGQTGFRPIP